MTRNVPDAVRERQSQASDPAASAFVSANAGSGKTHVLAERVIRLMLAGCDPQRILCITFTKAAAANMAARVFDTLAKWTALDDTALDAEIGKVGAPVDARRRNLARRLFAKALETPGGLKVQTIHAFCTRLLQLFPFEANVPARFEVLEERTGEDVLDRATLSVLLDAAEHPETPLGRALAYAIAAAADSTFRDVVRETIQQRHRMLAWIESAGGIDAAIAGLARTLGVEADDSLEQIDKEFVEGPYFPISGWPSLAEACRTGTKDTDQKHCHRIAAALAATGRERIDHYLDIFLTQKGLPRAKVITKLLADSRPQLAEDLNREQERINSLLARRRALVIRDRTAALVIVAMAAIDRYRHEKIRRGALDYDDLIEKARALLHTVNASWVHYRLDDGIDHVLIDEAQDTSERQWDIVEALVAEFSAGAGARPIKRTIFAVGDEKQSIFSFQGAAPKQFDEMRRRFRNAFSSSDQIWRDVTFQHSFRSGVNVLEAVNKVFRDDVAASVTSDRDGIAPHLALPDARPGLVELWETEKAEPRREIEAWDMPLDALTHTSPKAALARRIANTVAKLNKGGMGYGDVLVLVRQRGPLFDAIIDALKKAGVAVAGADRLKLTAHIAIGDLIALSDAILSPRDDLALAVALKSPLFGVTEELLLDIAWNRSGTLRSALDLQASISPAVAQIAAQLARIEAMAQRATPFSLFAWLLGAAGGRAKILRRLGPEANEVLDEFLDLALAYERQETPSLQGFVAWLRAGETDIKRDMDIGRDEVRVMTVHGAKGLEARVVILADTTTKPEGSHAPRLLSLPQPNTLPNAPDQIVWVGGAKADVPAVSAARNRAIAAEVDEHRRLLYVAMTRAIERLIVCGCDGVRPRPARCWYDLINAALGPGSEELGDDDVSTVRRYRFAPDQPAPAPSESAPYEAMTAAAPAWLRQPHEPDPARKIALAPSAALAPESEAMLTTSAERSVALARGIVVHRLLQSLPDVAPERRGEIGRRYLDNVAAMPPEQRDEILSQVLALMANPDLAVLFSEASRAEAPIVGALARRGRPPLQISGQIDRLCISGRDVLIADYKSSRPAPREIAAIPPAYVAQLALYRAVLTKLYPAHTVRAALIWTEIPALMEVPASALDAALAQVMSA